jgi:hypothetical protein
MIKIMNKDRRQFTRIPFDTQVILHSEGRDIRAQLLDVSMKGALVKIPGEFDGCVGHKVLMILSLNQDDAFRIEMKTDVSHIHGLQLGLKCLGIDVDSATNLRKLIEFNLGEPELLDRELSAMLT